MTQLTALYRDTFLQAYMTCLLWSASDEDGDPIDDRFTVDHFSQEATDSMTKDCNDFMDDHADLLASLDAEQCGHDFALTRNRHGTGFWDRGLGEVGRRLAEGCRPYGASDVMIVTNQETGCDELEVYP